MVRHLSVRCPRYAAYAWSNPGDPITSAVLARWGLRPSGEWAGAETVAGLLAAHPNVNRLILAMDHVRACEILAETGSQIEEIEVWTPDGEGEGPDSQRVRALADVLHLSTTHPVGLFIDWESAQGADGNADPQQLAQECLRRAELVGAVVTARVYGRGGVFDQAGVVPDAVPAAFLEGGAEWASGASLLQADLRALLDDPRAPRSWIVVSDAAWVGDLLRSAHRRGIRVALWAPREEQLPVEVRADADACVALETVVGSRFQRDGVALRSITVDSDTLSIREAVLPESAHIGARLGPWLRLIYHTECILRQSGNARLPVRTLAASLAELEEFGPTPVNAMEWINLARADGALLLEPEWRRDEVSARVTLCRTNSEHPLVQMAVAVPDRCLRLLNQMLQKIPWVSFKVLRNVLLREQWLGGPPFHLDGAGIDEWLNFLIQDGAMRMTKEPNLVNPDYPVTALRLNQEHPLSGGVVAEAVEGTRLAAERAILAVDHFMIRNRKPWMAMGALRRALETMGREELQAVLQGLQNLGALVTESYPNPQKEHSTTGCRLKPDEPMVMEALTIRNLIIRVTLEHQRSRNWVSLSQVVEDMNRASGIAPNPAYRVAWFLLLRDEGILELDHDGHLPGAGWENVRCRLNETDAVVRAAIADQRDPSHHFAPAAVEDALGMAHGASAAG
ncbi:MAG: hypothetical protein ACO1SX_29505 [Actinomycetota bacterium]